MQTPRRKGYSHSWEGHKDIFLEAREILFPLWVPLQGVLGSNRLLLLAKEEKTKQPREVSATFTTERSLTSTVFQGGLEERSRETFLVQGVGPLATLGVAAPFPTLFLPSLSLYFRDQTGILLPRPPCSWS